MGGFQAPRDERGFSLVERTIAVAIIGPRSAIAAPRFTRAQLRSIEHRGLRASRVTPLQHRF